LVKSKELTPYAVLLARPTDSDDAIRSLYHVIARRTHPDAAAAPYGAAQEALKAEWHAATAAYTAIKTVKAREAWERSRKLLSGLCAPCQGVGTVGTRRFKGVVRLCAVCGGTGRV
jgi:curved DNA-binding protein CbpA